MKVFINMELTDQPYGGGNQFLKSLRNFFLEKKVLVNSYQDADIILYNSHHNLNSTLEIKKEFPNKVFIHRIDGPLQYRGRNGIKTDKKIFKFSNNLSDGQIFQSKWSLIETSKNYNLLNNNCVIHNAVDESIFYKKNLLEGSLDKVKLIAASWSDNFDKGFDIYKQLDDNLDFSKYSMTFIGNSPISFNNIKIIKPLKSNELAKQIRMHDIFIFASKTEACSNTLIEALSCGVPCVVRNSSSNPEILNNSGELFDSIEDLITKIDLVSADIASYSSKIKIKQIDQVGLNYLDFFHKTRDLINRNLHSRKISFFNYIKLKYLL